MTKRDETLPAGAAKKGCLTPHCWLNGAPAQGSAALAQLVEHIIRNDGVTCSSHVSGTTFFKVLSQGKSSTS
jgi:hypothetical protein